jgi:chaperonin GroEL (HSP60 family)
VRKALRIPCYTIAFNAGVDANEVVQRVLAEKHDIGYDAMNGLYVDMMKTGIIDPTKVRALRNWDFIGKQLWVRSESTGFPRDG